MQIRPALAVVLLGFSLTPGCSGDESLVSTGDTTGATDVTASEPATSTSSTPSAITTPSTAPAPDQTQPTATSTTATSTTATSTTAPRVTPPSEPVTVLVVDVDGAWLWTDGSRRLVIDDAVGSAIPDRVGGIVYQRVETGEWRPNWYDPPPNTAEWTWVGTGSAQPIRRVLLPGGETEIVVEAPTDGFVRIVDTAIVDGHAALAYLRTRHFSVTGYTDVNPWWDSRAAELVVHDLTTGDERVVRTQSIGWEYDGRAPSLGGQGVAEAVNGYGDGGSWIELLGFDGTAVEILDDVAGCEFSCGLVADLDPTGEQLAYIHRRPYVPGQIASEFAMTVLDPRTGSEKMGADLSLPDGTTVVSLDTVGGRALATTGSQLSLDDADHPVLGRGDRGPWVVVLQRLMSQWYGPDGENIYLAADGVFGPRTETAVRAFQAGAGLDDDGIVGSATWSELIATSGSTRQLGDPVLVEADGSSRRLPVLSPGVMVDQGSGPTMTLWSEP